jgi:ribose transport system substrate-binding protein
LCFFPQWLLALGLVGALAACEEAGQRAVEEGDAGPESAGGDADPPTVALVMKTLTNPFFVEMERGARRAEEEFGVDLVVRTAAQETSIEQQIDIVDDLVRSGIDALVIAPGDSVRLIPVLRQAQDAGVVVVNIDNRLDPDFMAEAGLDDIPFISVDNEEGAYLSAGYIAERADGPAEAVIIEGIRDADNAQARLRGARRAFADAPHVTLVASETANWKIDEAYGVTQAILEAHPGTDLIFAANDMMALGAVQYLQEAGLTGQIRIAGFDALDEAEDAIAAGAMAASVDQQAAVQGYLGIQYATRLLDGEQVPVETTVPVRLVTRESLAAAD